MRTPCSLNKFTLHIILQAINESDIIMSFVNYGHQEEFEFTRRFWFDVTEVRGGPSSSLGHQQVGRAPVKLGYLRNGDATKRLFTKRLRMMSVT